MAKRQAKSKSPAKVNYVPNTDIIIPINLPVVSRGQKPTKEQIETLAAFVCEMYATDLFPLKECLRFAGIKSEATWHFWKRENEAVKAFYENAKRQKSEVYRSGLLQRALTSLEKQVTGYTVDLEEVADTIEFKEEGIGDNKQLIETITGRTVRKKKIYIKPSPTATIFTLINLDPANYKRAPVESVSAISDPILDMSETELEKEISKLEKRMNPDEGAKK